MNTSSILRSTGSTLPHQLLLRATSSVASTSSAARRSYASRTVPASPSATLTARPQTSNASVTTDASLHDGKQSEGLHPRDQTPIVLTPSSAAGADSASLDLSTPFHGPWTLHSPVYTPDDLAAVAVVRRPPTCLTDRLAAGLVACLRKGFDIASGYRHVPMPTEAELEGRTWTTEELRKRGSTMTEDQWLMRIIFLESIAGVPGMVAGAIRHLHSLRLLRRDGGWIRTLLEEAENERMHLMTFMAVARPSRPLRALILVGQGVFYNLFFLSYLFAPKVAHRFVGCLEEEAVVTYTRAIGELRAGHLPLWEKTPAPEIAREYWRLSPGATMLDVLENVRSDESQHRFVNHTLAELDPKDFNPFALAEPPAFIKGTVAGFSRAEAGRFARDSRLALESGGQQTQEQEDSQQGFDPAGQSKAKQDA